MWQHSPKALCGFYAHNLTGCSTSAEPSFFKNLYQAVRVSCHDGMEQDYGIFGLIWKFEKTSEIILEYAQQTAW